MYFACKTALSKDDAEADLVLKQNVVQKSFSNAVKFKDFTMTGEQTKLDFTPKREEKPQVICEIPEEWPKKSEEPIVVDIPKIEFSRKTEDVVLFNDDSVKFEKNDEIAVDSSLENPFFNKKDEVAIEKSVEQATQNEPEHEDISEPPIASAADERFSGAKIIGELFGTYILMECENVLYLVDKHAAHERLIYNKLKEESGEIQRQYLLESIVFKPSREEFDILVQNKEIVKDTFMLLKKWRTR